MYSGRNRKVYHARNYLSCECFRVHICTLVTYTNACTGKTQPFSKYTFVCSHTTWMPTQMGWSLHICSHRNMKESTLTPSSGDCQYSRQKPHQLGWNCSQAQIQENHAHCAAWEDALDPVLLCSCAAKSAQCNRVSATTLASETERPGWSCKTWAAKSDKGAGFVHFAVGMPMTVSISRHLIPRGK